MKTTRFLFGFLFMSSLCLNAQNVASTATVTSGGLQAGNPVAGNNTFYGYKAGETTVYGGGTGVSNTFVGNQSGAVNVSGAANTFIGSLSGGLLQSGIGNVFLGASCGRTNTSGSYNTILGYMGGFNTLGSGNVLIGYRAGYNETGSDKLYIDNSNTATPLVWGDFANDQLKLNGKVGIGAVTGFPTNAGGVSVANYKLFVTGGILTDEVRVNLSSSGTWADYVFNKDYNLKPLSEVESFIKENGHLPNVPSAAQVKEEGIALGEMAKIQQEKIEELTLYIINQNKEIEKLKAQVKEVDELKKLVTELINKK